MYDPLVKTVGEMRTVAKQLLPHSFPQKTRQDEADIAVLKKREILVDGYEVVVYFNNAHYGDRILETLQVYGRYFSFLPFYLVCKVARAFLGDDKLSLVEVIHSSAGKIDKTCKKIYVWTLYYDTDGKRISGPFAENATPDNYDGLVFLRTQDKDIKFF